MLLHFKSSDENLKRSPVSSAVVFQSKLETVMYARGLRGLWYPAKPHLNPHMGMERERSIDNYRESEMRRWKCKAVIEAQDTNFVFNCTCLIMHEWVLEGDRLRRAIETENGRVRLASATPKKTWEKGGIKRGEERIQRERERERLQIPGVRSSATQPVALTTKLCRNPKVPMLRGKDSGGKGKATTSTHSITETRRAR